MSISFRDTTTHEEEQESRSSSPELIDIDIHDNDVEVRPQQATDWMQNWMQDQSEHDGHHFGQSEHQDSALQVIEKAKNMSELSEEENEQEQFDGAQQQGGSQRGHQIEGFKFPAGPSSQQQNEGFKFPITSPYEEEDEEAEPPKWIERKAPESEEFIPDEEPHEQMEGFQFPLAAPLEQQKESKGKERLEEPIYPIPQGEKGAQNAGQNASQQQTVPVQDDDFTALLKNELQRVASQQEANIEDDEQRRMPPATPRLEGSADRRTVFNNFQGVRNANRRKQQLEIQSRSQRQYHHSRPQPHVDLFARATSIEKLKNWVDKRHFFESDPTREPLFLYKSEFTVDILKEGLIYAVSRFNSISEEFEKLETIVINQYDLDMDEFATKYGIREDSPNLVLAAEIYEDDYARLIREKELNEREESLLRRTVASMARLVERLGDAIPELKRMIGVAQGDISP